MRVLEARFYPRSKAHGRSVVIAQVVCDDERIVVEPADISKGAVVPFDCRALLHKLRWLTEATTPRAFDLLKHFRSDFWSFVEISGHRER
jgi:hypothetical protein